MTKAVYHNGEIHPTEPIPDEWVDWQGLEIVALPTPIEVDLEEWYRDLERIAAEMDDDECEQLDAALQEADRIEKERMRKEMGHFVASEQSPSMDYRKILEDVTSDPRYLANLDWGKARPGHPEGTVRAHIAEIEPNLERLRPNLSDDDYWKLKLLIHTHDSFKAEAKRGVSITDPESHASLARAFLALHCDDEDLLAMVQYHDEPFALYRQFESKGKYNQDRFDALLNAIRDWNLFLAFNIIDGCTAGKSREPLEWLFQEVTGKVESNFAAADIIR